MSLGKSCATFSCQNTRANRKIYRCYLLIDTDSCLGVRSIFKTKGHITCITSNVIYVITCRVWGVQYVGETRNSIADRLNQHRYYINNGTKNSLVIQHFRTHGLQAMSVTGLQTNDNWTEGQRRFTERQWINKLDTAFPYGLNMS